MEDNYEVTVNGSLANYTNHTSPKMTYPMEVPHIKVIVNICYVLVFICCIVGNLLVILVVLVHPKMRTITNFFLANLAVADFFVGVFCVIPAMEYQKDLSQKLGTVMCKLNFYVQCASYNASITILTIISIERYFAIIHPMRSKQIITLRLLRVVIIIAWIFAALSAAPLPFFFTVQDSTDENKTFCMQVPGLFQYVKTYVMFSFVFLYLVPLGIMTVIYIRISIVLWKTSKTDGLMRNTATGVHNMRAFLKPTKGKLVSFSKTVVRLDDKVYEPVGAANAQTCTSSSDEANRKDDTPENKDSSPQIVEENNLATDDDVSDDLQEANDYENDWPTDRHRTPDGIKLYQKTVPLTSDPEKVEVENAGCTSSSTAHTLTQRAVTKQVQGHQQNALTARRKVIRLLVTVLLAFTLCLLPYHVRLLVLYWNMGLHMSLQFQLWLALLAPLIMYFQSGLNPILYAFLSENFRKSFREIICCRHRRRQRGLRSTTMSMRTANSTLSQMACRLLSRNASDKKKSTHK